MSLLSNIMDEIGQDADLLTRSDEWLEQERLKRATELEQAAKELHAIQLAQKIKLKLQQKNMVAVQQILRDADGEILNIIVRIMHLPDALSMLASTDSYDTVDEVNVAAQVHGWERDGYDVKASAALRVG